MKKVIIFISILLISLFSVSASCLFEDDFEYTDELSLRGWEYSGSHTPIDGYVDWQASYGSLSLPSSYNTSSGETSINFNIEFTDLNTDGQVNLAFRGLSENDILKFKWDNSSAECSAICGDPIPPCLILVNGSGSSNRHCLASYIFESEQEYQLNINFDTGFWRLYRESEFIAQTFNKNLTFDPIQKMIWNGVFDAEWRLYDISCNALDCIYPLLFCDEFNYGTPLIGNDWSPYRIDNTVDNTVIPINGVFDMTDGEFLRPFHSIDKFQSNHPLDELQTITETEYSPVFTAEFLLDINESCVEYSAFDSNFKTVWDFYFCANGSIYHHDDWYCDGCIDTSKSQLIRIASTHANNSLYPFISSFQDNRIWISVQDSLLSNDIKFVNNNSVNIKQFQFKKETDDKLTIDNYYIMAGNDKRQDTSTYFYTPLYSPTLTNITETGLSADADFQTRVIAMYSIFGIKSAASRFIVGFMVMFLIVLSMLGSMLKAGIDLSGGAALMVVIVVFLLSVVFTYIKLFPFWILFIEILAIFGFFALMIKAGQ